MIQTKDEQAKRPERTFIMYPNNIYIKNYNEVKQYPGDIGIQLDQYDNAHGIKHDDRDLLGI